MRRMSFALIQILDKGYAWSPPAGGEAPAVGEVRASPSLFLLFSSRVEFVPYVTSSKYRLFQAADMIATLELIRIKLENEGRISDTEKMFFLSIQNLKKNYLKLLERKRWI